MGIYLAGVGVAFLALIGNVTAAVMTRRSTHETGFTEQFHAVVDGFERRVASLEREVKLCEDARDEDRVRIRRLETQPNQPPGVCGDYLCEDGCP